jgi:pre-mRNA-splicing factor 38A
MEAWDFSNRTNPSAKPVHGKDPQFLIDAIIRSRIYDSTYWKEHCFALNEETVVDKAVELTYIGGVYGANHVPTPFICLLLKLLAIQPAKEIILEFIQNNDYKYVSALGMLYWRLTASSDEIYQILEVFYSDYRKLKRRLNHGGYDTIPMDVYVDELLHAQRCCDVTLPSLMKREVLEQTRRLKPRQSVLKDEFEQLLECEEQEMIDS